MRVLKERLFHRLIGAVLCAAAAAVFACLSAWQAAALLAAGCAALTIFAFRCWESYQAARLIAENPLLQVGVASVAQAGASETLASSVNVVVSGFGILMDEKPYKFGHGGVNLTAAAIDRESITLTFGDEKKTYSVRLLHGMADKAEADDLIRRLRYETGVMAEVSGW